MRLQTIKDRNGSDFYYTKVSAGLRIQSNYTMV